LYHVCRYGIADNSRSSYIRCRHNYGRWSVEKDPDKIGGTGETNETREAHQKIEEPLDLVYFAHDAVSIRLFSYGRVVTSSTRPPEPFD
jgi:hypothetical protein